MRKQPALRLAGILSVAVMTLAACGGTSSSGNPSAGGGAGSSGGTLTYGYTGGGLTSLDPNTIKSGTEKPVASLLFDSLTQLGPDGSVQPDLATSWTSSNDLKTWTFKLRSGVKYHSGKTFTAADAVKNINYVLDPKNNSSQRKRITDIASVKANGDNTLLINLKTPNALMPSALMWIYMSNIDTIGNVNQNGDGTGPFKLKDFVSDDHLDLVRFNDYWGPKPKVDAIKIERTADATSALTSLQTGELDVLWGIDPSQVGSLKSDSKLTFLKPAVTSGTTVFMLDTTSPPFNNVKARQALSYAVDRKTMAQAAYNGLANVSLENDPVGTDSPYYDSSLPKYNFDLNKAKQLFAEAGVQPGDTLTFWTMSGRRGEWTTMGEILQQDLQKIGLKMQIKQEEQSTWVAKFAPAGKTYPNLVVADFLSFPPVAGYALQFFQTGGCECNWNNSAFDSLMTKAIGTKDPSARKTVYASMQQMFNQQVPAVVLMQNATIVAAQKSVHGLWVEGDGTLRMAGASLGS